MSTTVCSGTLSTVDPSLSGMWTYTIPWDTTLTQAALRGLGSVVDY